MCDVAAKFAVLRLRICANTVQLGRPQIMRIIDIIRDDRIAATSVLLDMTFAEYQRLAMGAEQNLDIQRRIVRGFKPYEQLRKDLKDGCLIPPPVLATRQGLLPDPHQHDAFVAALGQLSPEHVYIVDGLQRTNAIEQVVEAFEDTDSEAAFLNR